MKLPFLLEPEVVLAASGLGHVARGFERATLEIARALTASGSRVLTVRGGGAWIDSEGLRLPCVQRFGDVATALHWSEPGAYGVEQRTFGVGLYSLLRATGARAVHLHEPATMNVVWHLRARFGGQFKLVFTNGGSYSPEHLHRPDIIHCVTPLHAQQMLDHGHHPSRVHMVPYGLQPPALIATPASDGPLRVIGVGAISKDKGVEVAIDAVSRVNGAHLTFLGQETPETGEIKATARRLLPGRHRIATVLPQKVTAELAAAHAFVLPTRYEAFGLAILEAMGSGLACVVSDLPVTRWLVGDAGILVAADDTNGWRQAIASLTDAGRRVQLGLRAQQRAREFDWQALLPRYAALYGQA